MISHISNGNDLVCGGRSSNGTLVVIPPNKVWCGQINISGSIVAAGSATATVVTAGDCKPDAGTVVASLSMQALLSTAVGNSSTIDALVWAGPGGATLTFATGGVSTASAVANGYIV